MTDGPGAVLPGELADMSVREMVEATPLAGILDRPVGEVLADLGLPPLPALPELPPLPGLPPLPVLDPSLLMKPLTDLLGGFGSGDLGAAGLDPSAIFSGLSTVLETSLGIGQAALDALDQLWSGSAALGAAVKTAQASTNSAALSAQGTGMSFDIQAAAGIVGAGLVALQGVIAATVAKLTATLPVITTPLGASLAVAFVTEGLAEGTAIVAATRAQLLAPTTHMAANGTPVPITSAPVSPGSAPSPFAIAGSILEAVSPVLTAAVSLPSTLIAPLAQMGYDSAQLTESAPSTATVPASMRGPDDPSGPDGGADTGAAGVGAVAGLGGLATPLSAARTGASMTEPAAVGAGPTAARTTTTAAAPIAAPIAPMGALGAARAAGGLGGGEAHELPDYLVTEDHGEHLVGEDGPVAPAVFGAQAAPSVAPDIALRLLPIAGGGPNVVPPADDASDHND